MRYSRANQRAPAIYYLSQALTLAPKHNDSDLWRTLLQSNQYWHLLAKADEALLNQEYPAAKRYFTQVRQLSPYKSEAYIGLGISS